MVFHENLFPKIRARLEQFAQPISDFVRSNPIISSAIVGVTALGSIAAVTSVVRRKRKRRAAKKRAVRSRKAPRKRAKRVKRRKRHVTHASPRHRGHKRVSFTTASGKKVSFLVKKKSSSHRIKRRKR